MTQGAKTADVASGRRLCRLETIADGDATEIEAEVDGIAESIVVLRRGDRAHAYLNVCPHAGRRMDWAPGRFLVKDGILVCAVHGASFRTDTGLCVGGPCRGASLIEVPVRVDGDGNVELV